MNILYVAEIVGKCGIWAVKTLLPQLKVKYRPDYVIANANSASGAGGLSAQSAGYLRKLGIHCLTLGDNAFLNAQIFESGKPPNFCVRPVNLPRTAPGLGYKIFHPVGAKIGERNEIATDGAVSEKKRRQNVPISLIVVSLLGQYGRHRLAADNPFEALDDVLRRFEACPIVVDYAAFSTAEKQMLKFYADGKVSAIIGSGAKVATADAGLSKKGTAFITDAGRTGSFLSSGGYEHTSKIREFKTGLTEYSASAWEAPRLDGVFVKTDAAGKATNIERFFLEKDL